MCSAPAHVCFTPNSDRESRHPQTVMSALPPKADMCSAPAHVCFGPKADSCSAANSPIIRALRQRTRTASLALTARPRWCLLSNQFGFEHLHTRYTHCERHTAEALAKSFGQIVTSSFLRHWTIIGTNSVLRPA